MIVTTARPSSGGRNVGDEYMGLNAEFNSTTSTCSASGPWPAGQRRLRPLLEQRLGAPHSGCRSSRRRHAHAGGDRTAARRGGPPAMQALVSGARSWRPNSAPAGDAVDRAQPRPHRLASRAASSRNHMPEAFRALMRSARREVLISNAYIIPDENFMGDLRELAGRGVKVRILHQFAGVARRARGQCPLRKLAPRHPAVGRRAARIALRRGHPGRTGDTPPVRSGFVGLHVKAMVIDRERSFIGSMNLDPRSEVFQFRDGGRRRQRSTGAGPGQGHRARHVGANSWQVALAGDGSLRWRSDAGERSSQPARSFWQRVQNLVFKLAPASYY